MENTQPTWPATYCIMVGRSRLDTDDYVLAIKTALANPGARVWQIKMSKAAAQKYMQAGHTKIRTELELLIPRPAKLR
jgi:hypothetical protein